MSADNGWILRKNQAGEYVLHQYWASAESYPAINDGRGACFPNMQEAINWYEAVQPYSEYGLTIHTDPFTPDSVLPKYAYPEFLLHDPEQMDIKAWQRANGLLGTVKTIKDDPGGLSIEIELNDRGKQFMLYCEQDVRLTASLYESRYCIRHAGSIRSADGKCHACECEIIHMSTQKVGTRNG